MTTPPIPVTEPAGTRTGLQWCRDCGEIGVAGTDHECRTPDNQKDVPIYRIEIAE